MLKTFQKIVKQIQGLPEREFQTGRTQEQALEHIRSIWSGSGNEKQLYSYLYAHDPDIRRTAAQALKDTQQGARNAADTQIMSLSLSDTAAREQVHVRQFVTDWEAQTSLAPGAYWTPVVLAGLVDQGVGAQTALYAVVRDKERSVNTRIMALWAIGLIGEQEGHVLSGVYTGQTNQGMQQAVVRALRFFGPVCVPDLCALLGQEQDEDLCLELALALGWMGSDAVINLKQLFGSEKRIVREYAGLGLLAAADPNGWKLLWPLKASQKDGRLKALINEAIIALRGTWEELSSFDGAAQLCTEQRILAALNRVDNELLAIIFVSMLAHVSGHKRVSALQKIIHETNDEQTMFQACQVLGACEANSELESMLGQGNTFMRTYACLALLASGFPVMQSLARS
jgi:hypothetical protein